jgi:LysR family transcriptional activator for leuABCD operon
MFNLRTLDLNLLTLFEAVYETRSITAAAEQLGMTQSAASHALGRLRDAIRDELFLRSSAGLIPTASAQVLYPAVRESLDTIREAVSGKATFDPGRSRRTFRIAIPHVMGPFIGLQLEHHIREAAPAVTLSFDTRTLPADPLADLQKGRTDVSVDWMAPAEDGFVSQHLFDDRLLLIVRRGHPRITKAPALHVLDRERFVTLHARPSALAMPAAVRQVLAVQKWKSAFRVSEFLEIPVVVAASDLVGIMPLSMMRALRAINLLELMPLPIDVPPVPIVLTWHGGRRRDPGHAWLRRMVRQQIKRFAAESLREGLPSA